MGKTANLELNTTEMSDKISDFVGEYNSNMNMLDDLYGDVQDDASSALSTAQSADTKATAAQTAAGNAVTTANSANSTAQSANTTAGQANTAATAAQTAASNAVTTANEAKTIAQNAAETAEGAEDAVANKADIDGNYETLTVGQAEQLVSTVYVEDSEPYNFRTAGGSADIGDRTYEEVVGGSIVWNQIVDPTNLSGTRTAQGITYTNNGNGSITVNGTATSNSVTDIHTKLIEGANRNGHVLLVHFSNENKGVALYDSYSVKVDYTYTSRLVKLTANNNTRVYLSLRVLKGVSVDNVTFKPQVFDLTQMFGSTIADYIYSLEQGTEGAGVAWFRNLFPKPYYAYNAGELMSVKAGSHDTVGFNAFNKSTVTQGKTINNNGNVVNNGTTALSDFIDAVPSTVYYINNISARVNANIFHNYDASKNYLGPSGSFEEDGYRRQTFSNTRYIRIVFNKDEVDTACVNIAWDGERNGEYEPYEKHTYPLANIELRGIPKLDANNQLYYDGDTYASDGTVTRKYGVVTIDGTTTGRKINGMWGTSTEGNNAFYITINGFKRNNDVVCLVSDKFVWNRNSWGSDTSPMPLWGFGGQNGADSTCTFMMPSTITTVAEANAWFASNPTTIVYELATPTTETADSFTNPQVVDDFGTEEYVDYAYEAGDRDVAVPVGHDSQYMNNLRAKLEMAPDSPSGDGKYIVQQSNGENSYVPYTADGRLDAIEAKLPAPPSANGTYKLTATVSNNGVTYSWQS